MLCEYFAIGKDTLDFYKIDDPEIYESLCHFRPIRYPISLEGELERTRIRYSIYNKEYITKYRFYKTPFTDNNIPTINWNVAKYRNDKMG